MPRATCTLAWWLVGCLLATEARSAYREDFEGPDTSWRPAGGDVRFQVVRHVRIRQDAYEGNGCEYIQLVAGNGSSLFWAHDIGKARVIDELQVTVWVRSDRPGARLLARIVLPRTLQPETGRPITALVRGPPIEQVGTWQPLRLANVPQLLEREVWVLRSRLGPAVDRRGAYVDQILLDLASGPGSTSIWIDALEVVGLVRPERSPVESPGTTVASRRPGGSAASAAESRPSHALHLKREGAVLLADQRPILPRVIRHRGEPLSLLKGLGFNLVWFDEVPSPALLAEAETIRMGVICPPPSSLGAAGTWLGTGLGAVAAWDLGSGLAGPQLAALQQQVDLLRRIDPRSDRLLIGRPETKHRAYSRILDVLVAGRDPVASSLTLRDYATWLAQQPLLARPGTSFWAHVQTQLPADLLRQQAAFLALLGRGSFPPASPGQGREPMAGTRARPESRSAAGTRPASISRTVRKPQTDIAAGIGSASIDHVQLDLLAWMAISSGCRGLLFDSHSSLAAADPDTRFRSLALEMLNLKLSLVQPWLASASVVTTVGGSAEGVTAAVLASSAEQVRLLMPIRWPKDARRTTGSTGPKAVSFVLPAVSEASEAYEVTPVALRRLRRKRVTGGLQVVLDSLDATAMILLTQDPRVESALSERISRLQGRAARLARELAVAKLRRVEAVQELLGAVPAATPPAGSAAALRTVLDECDSLLRANQHVQAFAQATRLSGLLGAIEQTAWAGTAGRQAGAAARPLAIGATRLPDHWALVRQLSARPAGANRLAGGDFENLSALLQAGWQHHQFQAEGVPSAVQLSAAEPKSGRFCLQLRAWDGDPQPGFLAAPPVWVTSPPVPVAAGELVRIHGWVRVVGPIGASVDGLMLVDSLGGPALAERIGPAPEWQEFSSYRIAADSGTMSVSFVLTGLGQAEIDDVTIAPISLPAGAPAP